MRVFIGLFACLFLLTGCRTYGGYDSEEALYAQIEKTNQQFADELNRARSEFSLIQNAASSNRMFAPFVDQYEAILEDHAEKVEAHAGILAGLEVKTGFIGQLGQSYRMLNRGLGSILTDQAQVRDAYVHLLNNINREAKGEAFTPVSIPEPGRYQAVPPFYEAIRYALESVSPEQAVQPAAGG